MPEQGSSYTFEDLSGSTANDDDSNPYNGLIRACDNDPTQIQARYSTHRTARAQQQREKILSPTFPGVTVDPILRSLLEEAARPPDQKTGYQDERNCLVFWARPPAPVRDLIVECQRRLRAVLPSNPPNILHDSNVLIKAIDLWFMPTLNMHMTALEVTHSRTPDEIAALIAQLGSHGRQIADYPREAARQCALVKPMVTYDAAAMALSFLPAATGDEPGLAQTVSSEGKVRSLNYTYHHLRRDLHDLTGAHVEVGSRYVVPSAHLTIARFVNEGDTTVDGSEGGEVSKAKMEAYVNVIDEVNEWLEKEVWALGEDGGSVWIVGKDRGLDWHCGRLWYGGGDDVKV